MIKSKGTCVVNAADIESITVGGPKDAPQVTVVSRLLQVTEDNSAIVLHGKMKLEGGWPDEVIKAVQHLQTAVERHLLRLHFEEGVTHDEPIGGEPDLPKGLGGPGLVYSTSKPEQL